MAATRTSRSRSRRNAPAGLRWDQAQLAPIVLIRAGEEVLADRAVSSLLAQAKAKDPTTEVTRLEAATYEPHQLDTLVSPSLFGEPRLVYVPALEQMTDALLADLIAYVPGFQPSLDKAVKEVGSGPTVVDLSKPANLVHHEGVEEEHEHSEEASAGATDTASAVATAQSSEAGHDDHGHAEHSHAEGGEDHDGDLDPHFWLDPQRMIKVAETLEASFAQVDPANANDYKAGLDKLKTALTGVDNQYKQGLTSCQHKTFITSHAAFGYMAERYGLTQASISGIDPETEPSPAEMANIKSVVQSTGVKTIFTEELVSDAPAKAIAAETGAETSVLSPLESKPERGDYTDAMTSNLERLKGALVCQ